MTYILIVLDRTYGLKMGTWQVQQAKTRLSEVIERGAAPTQDGHPGCHTTYSSRPIAISNQVAVVRAGAVCQHCVGLSI